MFNKIVLSPSSNRLKQHIDFFKEYMTDVFQIDSENASSATFSSIARGNRKFILRRSGDYIYSEFNKLFTTGVIKSMVGLDYAFEPFVYKIYKNGESGVLYGYGAQGIQCINIIWTTSENVTSVLLGNYEYSGLADVETINLFNFPSDRIFPSTVSGFVNKKDLILPNFCMNATEDKISDKEIDNILYFTNFKENEKGSEIQINGENYVLLSRSRILKY